MIWSDGEHFAVNNKISLLLVNDIRLQRFPLRLTDTPEKQRGPSSHPQGHWRPNFIWTPPVWRGRCVVPQWWQHYLLAFCQALGSCRQRCSLRVARSSDRHAAAKKRLFLFTGRKKATRSNFSSVLNVACGTRVAHISQAENPSTRLNFSVA